MYGNAKPYPDTIGGRLASMTEFMATLLEGAARVINCGGYVRYQVGGEERFAVRYLAR